MALPLGSESFIRRRAPLVQGPRGDAFYRDWDNAVDTTVSDVMAQPFILSEKLNYELTIEREFARTGMRFFAPPGTDIEYTDRIIYRGDEYTVLGHPGVWVNFEGDVDHVAFIARIREG